MPQLESLFTTTKDPHDATKILSAAYTPEVPWRRAWQPTPVFLPQESHGQRSLVGYSLPDCTESDMTEQLSTHAQPNK